MVDEKKTSFFFLFNQRISNKNDHQFFITGVFFYFFFLKIEMSDWVPETTVPETTVFSTILCGQKSLFVLVSSLERFVTHSGVVSGAVVSKTQCATSQSKYENGR